MNLETSEDSDSAYQWREIVRISVKNIKCLWISENNKYETGNNCGYRWKSREICILMKPLMNCISVKTVISVISIKTVKSLQIHENRSKSAYQCKKLDWSAFQWKPLYVYISVKNVIRLHFSENRYTSPFQWKPLYVYISVKTEISPYNIICENPHKFAYQRKPCWYTFIYDNIFIRNRDIGMDWYNVDVSDTNSYFSTFVIKYRFSIRPCFS